MRTVHRPAPWELLGGLRGQGLGGGVGCSVVGDEGSGFGLGGHKVGLDFASA